MKINLITVLFRSVEKNLIIFFHNLVIVIGIYVYFGIWPGWVGLIVIPGFLLVLMNLLVIGLPLAILGARFRDVAQITQSLLQVIFFLTPIFWFPNSLSKDSWIILLNPATHYIDLIRSPLLGQYPTLNSWAISIFIFITSLFVAIWAYRSKKQQVVFWI
jgi:ABC-type polysaccharide/polyol phosphate export permease